MNEMMKAAGTALVGAAMTFAANALSLSGRVEALEQGQARIETMVQTILTRELKAAQ